MPVLREEDSPMRGRSKAERDLEKAIISVDEARYENARWWRNINRIMSVLGLLVIGAIVSCGVFLYPSWRFRLTFFRSLLLWSLFVCGVELVYDTHMRDFTTLTCRHISLTVFIHISERMPWRPPST